MHDGSALNAAGEMAYLVESLHRSIWHIDMAISDGTFLVRMDILIRVSEGIPGSCHWVYSTAL